MSRASRESEQFTSSRPQRLHNGQLSKSLNIFDIVENDKPPKIDTAVEGAIEIPPEACVEKKFKCEYYWASDTNSAKRADTTYFCTVFVCKGMSVKVAVLPDTCSGGNKVGVTKTDHDVYYSSAQAYACSNTGCGECSGAQLTAQSSSTLAFLQGCNGNSACYGQIEVTVSKASAYSGTGTVGGLRAAPSTWQQAPPPHQYLSGTTCPKFRGGHSNRGQYPITVSDLSLNWAYKIPLGFKSSPVIDSDGTVYIGADDFKVYALDPITGQAKWKFQTEGKVVSTGVLSADRVLYIGSEDSRLYALSLTGGLLKWSFATKGKIHSSPAIGGDGTIYVGSQDGRLYAIRPTGVLRWAFSTEKKRVETLDDKGLTSTKGVAGAVMSSPAISSIDGTIYFGSDDAHLYALSTTGDMIFAFKAGGSIYSSPAISRERDVVYFGSDDGYLYAISSTTGTLKWKFKTGGRVRSSPAVGPDGTIFVATDKTEGFSSTVDTETCYIYAVTISGALKWKVDSQGGTGSSPAVGSDGTVYIGTDNHRVVALSGGNGKAKYEFKTICKVTSSASISSEGVLYIGTWASSSSAATCSLFSLGKKVISPEKQALLNQQQALLDAQGSGSGSLSHLEGDSTSIGQVPATLTTTSTSPSLSPEWACNSQVVPKNMDLETQCISRSDDGRSSCIPGLSSFIGRGVDITYDTDDLDFIQERVFDFSDLLTKVTLSQVEHVAPSDKVLTIRTEESSLSTDKKQTGRFSSVSEFSLFRANGLGIPQQLLTYPAPRMQSSTALAILVNATALRSEDVEDINAAAKKLKYTFTHSSSHVQATLRMKVPSSVSASSTATVSNAPTCARSFKERVEDLPDLYDKAIYNKFVQDFGTHVLVGGSIGGCVSTWTALSACSVQASFASVDEALTSYSSTLGKFTVSSTAKSVDFMDIAIDRSMQRVCGGDEEVYEEEGEVAAVASSSSSSKRTVKTAWELWSDSVASSKERLCLVNPELIPIWAAISSSESVVRGHVAATVMSYLKTVNLNSQGLLKNKFSGQQACH